MIKEKFFLFLLFKLLIIIMLKFVQGCTYRWQRESPICAFHSYWKQEIMGMGSFFFYVYSLLKLWFYFLLKNNEQVYGMNVAIAGKTTLAISEHSPLYFYYSLHYFPYFLYHPFLFYYILIFLFSTDMPDLSRYAKRPSDQYWQLLIIPVIYTLFSLIGIVIASSGEVIYGKVY